jgi:nucleoside-diphosphate-sugar epimerase
VIVDDDDRLCGVVSPGDLRKAILNGHNADTPLRTVMNSAPVSIGHDQLNKEASVNAVLAEFRRLYTAGMMYALAPVIDNDGRVLGLIDLQSLAQNASEPGLPVSHRRVLVIGGAGYIGSMLTRQLLGDGWSVRVLDQFLYSQDSLAGLDDKRIEIVKGDVKNIDTVVDAIDRVDAVVYLAELVGDPAVSIAPQTALKTNYLAVTALAHLCAYLNINRFVYTSSSSVYGASRTPDEFLSELSPTAPVSLYGKIKLLVEESVLSMVRQPNRLFAPTVLRLGTVFGLSHRARFDLVVNTLIKNAHTSGRIELFGGNQWRPQVHVADVGRAITKVLDAPLDAVRAQIFNVGGTKHNHTIDALGEMVKQVYPTVTVIRKNVETDPRNYRVNCDKIRDVLGFEPEMSVLDGMIELKGALEAGRIDDADEPRYSNFQTVQGLAFE